jgi:CheY-like chemotaxis protein
LYVDKALHGYNEVAEGDYAALTVSDNGIGIKDEDLKRIFEPFYSRKMMGRSGTGLGMAVVWGTVKDHNGYIDVVSRIGEGTTFTLYFPITRKTETHKADNYLTRDLMGNGQTILVVDDVEAQREIADGILSRLGYKVTTVSSGETAIEYLEQNSVDLVILDMIMEPGLDGLTTFQKILEIAPDQKAILASGFSENERVRQARELGARQYLKKPYTLEAIGVAVKEEFQSIAG